MAAALILGQDCFIVRDHNGRWPTSISRTSREGARRHISSPATRRGASIAKLPELSSSEVMSRAAAHLLTRDKARSISANIAKLPELK